MANKIRNITDIEILVDTDRITDDDTLVLYESGTLSVKRVTLEQHKSYFTSSAPLQTLNVENLSASQVDISQLYISGDSDISGNLEVSGSGLIRGDLEVLGKVTAKEFHTLYVSSSIVYQTGSTKFGDTEDDVHQFTGSLYVSGGTLNGDGTGLHNLRIGVAEDGTYEDGLFVSFQQQTVLGTAIDKINEVLKGLAPAPAPELTNLETQNNTAKTMNISFDDIVAPIGYVAVTASLADLPNKGISETFSIINGPGGNRTRLGVFSQAENLEFILNNNTEQNGALFVNYPADAFNVPTDGVGTYILEINGTQIITNQTLDTNSFVGSNFILSSANIGTYITTGLPFDLFRHRTGTVTVTSDLWRLGHNYIKVIHDSTLGTKVTNYADWVYDPSATNGTDDYNITSNVDSLTTGTIKYLSGIAYYTFLEYYFSASIENYYKNVYPTSANGGVTIVSMPGYDPVEIEQFTSTPAPTSFEDVLQRSSRHYTGQIRLLGESLSSRMSVDNTLGKTGINNLTTPTILLDNISTANTERQENFCLENWRLPSASYDSQASLSVPAFASSDNLATTDLAVFDGSVRYARNTINNGNIVGSGIVVMHGTQPDYSSFVDECIYIRKFRNRTSSEALFNLSITGENVTFVTVDTPFLTTAGPTADLNRVKISLKIPGKTGWRDIMTPIGIGTSEDVGCLGASFPGSITTPATKTFKIDWGLQSLLGNELFIIRIKASKWWQGYINKLDITY